MLLVWIFSKEPFLSEWQLKGQKVEASGKILRLLWKKINQERYTNLFRKRKNVCCNIWSSPWTGGWFLQDVRKQPEVRASSASTLCLASPTWKILPWLQAICWERIFLLLNDLAPQWLLQPLVLKQTTSLENGWIAALAFKEALAQSPHPTPLSAPEVLKRFWF